MSIGYSPNAVDTTVDLAKWSQTFADLMVVEGVNYLPPSSSTLMADDSYRDPRREMGLYLVTPTHTPTHRIELHRCLACPTHYRRQEEKLAVDPCRAWDIPVSLLKFTLQSRESRYILIVHITSSLYRNIVLALSIVNRQ